MSRLQRTIAGAVTSQQRWRRLRPAATLALLAVLPVARGSAQERLVGNQSAGIGMSYENIRFGGTGLRQYNFAGLDSARITGVRQMSLPITTAFALGSSWRVDLTTLYASATVSYRDAATPNNRRSATLSGISDVRVRATGTLISDLLVATAGINVPTGRTSLTNREFGVLRIMAAPSLGLGSTPVGAGASGTMGLVLARRAGPWSMAFGGSYEYRGSYQPVAALVAGSASADFQPGGVMRASVTADRTVGPHRLSVALAADVFADDELRTPPSTVGGTTGTGPSGITIVRLGPVFSADVQMLFAVPRFRQFMGYASFRRRAPFSRDGQSVAKSSGQYFDAGVRAAVAMGPQRDLILGADSRLHAGLGVDEGLPTSGVASGGLSAGLEIRRGLLSFQPYVRAQGGVLKQRGVGSSAPSQSFNGLAGGLVAVTRF
ncbi:MAG: hypothetical protein IPP90_19805 [Gemmatimonadaceae bacterium]|nr:hypothetical protein [Gemmatimonadaceae bacterium]